MKWETPSSRRGTPHRPTGRPRHVRWADTICPTADVNRPLPRRRTCRGWPRRRALAGQARSRARLDGQSGTATGTTGWPAAHRQRAGAVLPVGARRKSGANAIGQGPLRSCTSSVSSPHFSLARRGKFGRVDWLWVPPFSGRGGQARVGRVRGVIIVGLRAVDGFRWCARGCAREWLVPLHAAKQLKEHPSVSDELTEGCRAPSLVQCTTRGARTTCPATWRVRENKGLVNCLAD